MGYKIERLINNNSEEVDDDLKCGICGGLLEMPVVITDCEHLFCAMCLKQCLSQHLVCPLDNQSVTHSQIKAAPNIINRLISKLEISCDFAANGCQTVVIVNQLSRHVNECAFNPEKTQKSYACAVSHEIDCANKQQNIEQQKRIDCLELRVKTLEDWHLVVRRELRLVKSMIGYEESDAKVSGSSGANASRGKLLVKLDDKIVCIDADPNEPIATLKQKVQQIANICANDLLVFFANQELDDNRALIDYKLYRLPNPLFLIMTKKKFRILVRINRDKEYPLEVSPKDKVGDLLAKILKRESLATSNSSGKFVLSFRNQQLDENRTLVSHKIRDGNFVFLNTVEEIEQRKAALGQ